MKPSSSSSSLFTLFVCVMLACALAAGLALIESPATARARRLDEKRTQEIQQLSMAIASYNTKYNRLPDTLEQVQQPGVYPYIQSFSDPSGVPYEYRVKSAASYELCAHFDMAGDCESMTCSAPYPAPWKHESGRYCFALDVGHCCALDAKPKANPLPGAGTTHP